MSDLMIEMRDVKKSFGSKHVLTGIDIEVERGQSLVIIGGSGSGKSVTIKCIIGILHADSGLITIDGQDITHVKDSQRETFLSKFGMLFQGGALFDSLNVWQNVAFGLTEARRIPKDQAHATALEKLSRVGLGPEVAELYPAELSGGMQKRVGLARAIATEPEIIFFDEPTTGLDPIMADVINELIRECVQDLGATAVTITHDMSSVRKIADKVSMIHDGKIIWSGPRDQIDDCGNPYVEQFVSGSGEGPIEMQLLRP